MPYIVVYSQNDQLLYMKLSQGLNRWGGSGAHGVLGSGLDMVAEADVADANHAVGLLDLEPVVSEDDTFAGRYICQIPDELEESDLPYGLQAFTGATIADASDERGEFVWDGENVLTLRTVQVAAASVSFTITPIHSTASGGAVISGKATLYQHAPIDLTISIVDERKQPIDMTGKTLEFVVFDYDDEETEVFTVANSGITIGGADSNQLRVQAAGDGRTDEAGRFRWLMREINDTDPLLDLMPYGRGECLIVKMPAA